MKLNTHGWKMIGLEKVASQTKNLNGCYSDHNMQLNYDRKTGEVWVEEHVSSNSWVEYCNDDIVTVCCFYKPHTAQEIADIIAYTMSEVIACEEEMSVFREAVKAEMA